MSQSLILFVGVIYIIIGIDLCFQKQYGLGLTFVAYAVANLGLYLAARGV